ncbi:hypothetical protein IFM89_022060 [Coptis chinensis]|uniref:GRF1-interacting factor 1 n=1 Tax=Coptis chinensis TaxID=261450 RepID=A0A835H648_9MAGN|nr:hypothetical protein IFM89_022060 [Coptis chinensis]
MYLAAISDSQPQPHNVYAQYSGAPMQPGAHYMQHQQAQQMTQQQLMAARSSLLYAQPLSAMQQQQQARHGQLGMSSGGSSGLHMMHEGSVGGNGALGGGGYPDFGRGSGGEGLQASSRAVTIASKQDVGSGGP